MDPFSREIFAPEILNLKNRDEGDFKYNYQVALQACFTGFLDLNPDPTEHYQCLVIYKRSAESCPTTVDCWRAVTEKTVTT